MNSTESQGSSPSLAVSASYELRIRSYVKAVLSLPAIEMDIEIRPKDLLTTSAVPSEGRYRVEEHLTFAVDRGLVRPNAPLLVLGMRNSLVNLRAPVIWKGHAYSVSGEDPNSSLRPYYGLGLRDGVLVFDRAFSGSSDAESWTDFFCAGVPVLWDDFPETELFDLMLCEASDHSHLFNLPRGRHYLRAKSSRDAWSQLHLVFQRHVHSELAVAKEAMRNAVAACSPPLQRCDRYFHAVIGADASGGLVCLFAHARLEDLGQRLGALGCVRGVCVENSGSVTPTWFPSGLEAPGVPLVRVPNFRERGRAVLILELANQSFDSLPACCFGGVTLST